MFFAHHFLLKALSGLSKQGPMFRNSYVTGREARCSSTARNLLGKTKKDARAVAKQRLCSSCPPPSGTAGVARPFAPAWTPRVFLSHSNGRSPLCREWWRWCSSTPTPPPKAITTASWRLALPWESPGVGWWVTGATERANCAC
jgi:hypothetical protein